MNSHVQSSFARRRNRLRERCRDRGIDGYLTFDFSDVYYLSGFPSEGCFMLGSAAGDFIFSPSLLAGQVKSFVRSEKSLQVIGGSGLVRELEKILKSKRLRKIGYDSDKVTVALFKEISVFSQVRWVPLSGFVLRQRMIKDKSETDLIARACHITHKSARRCFENLRIGESEEQVSRNLSDLFYKEGASKLAFETIVAFGENSAFPHHVVSKKKLIKNSAVLMDLGCSLDGYRSDLTRTGFFGKIPSKFRKIYNIVKESQRTGVAKVRDGVKAGEVDFVCREIIRKAGYGDYYIHGTGHGVGLDIHEPPRLGVGSMEILKEGMVVTVEPGIYLPGEFGVRIEDTVLVKKRGCEVLTK